MASRLRNLLHVRRFARSDVALVLIDAVLIAVAWAAAMMLRYDAQVPEEAWAGWWMFLAPAVVVPLAAHGGMGLYSVVSEHASTDEARRVVGAQLGSVCVLVPLVLVLDRPVPLSVPLIAAGISVGLIGSVRFRRRLLLTRRPRAQDPERVLVIGCGSAGASLARDLRQRSQDARIVGFLDDDPRLLGRRVHGAAVLGRLDDLPEVAARVRPSYGVLAIPSASPELLRRLAPLAERAGLVLRVVPPMAELATSQQVRLSDVRDIEITDLLRRGEVSSELTEVTRLLQGKSVLITGAGGSIGSEIAKQVSRFGAARVVLLDHDETHLFDTAAAAPDAVQRLCDIREPSAVDQVFREERPQIVFHAAAHKHVPLLETHPVEAVETNVFGTRTVVEAAARVGVERFVFISTDKAVRPSSIMGATKSVGEKVVLTGSGAMTCCAVRFGNVLGSRGSVVPTFVKQIRSGGPVTVTDPRMTRYFMSIPEAVRLVLHAAALAEGGEIFMLDMGGPVSILDLAARMIRLSGRRPGIDVEIRVTGVRPGEKLHEELHVADETQHPTSHPAIFRLTPIPVVEQVLRGHLQDLRAAATGRDDARCRSLLHSLLGRPDPADIPAQKTAHGQTEKERVIWT